jgi:hypothetical protein
MENNNQKIDLAVSDFIKQIQAIFPDSQTFVAYITPYFFPIETEYNKILKILKKIGVTTGVEGTWGLICDTYKNLFTNELLLKSFMQGIVQNLQTRLPEAERAINSGEGLENTIKIFTWDVNMVSHVKNLFENLPAQTHKKIGELDKKTKALPLHEQELCKEFNLFVHRLYLNYLITHLPPSYNEIVKIVVKMFLLQYYESANELYGKEIASPKIIEHIKNIHIVGEAKLLAEIKTQAQPQTNATHELRTELRVPDNFETPVKAYSPIELTALYGVTDKTFNSWIKKHAEKIGKLTGKRYTPQQVRVIFRHLGEPDTKKK